jgi:DNA-binding MarR family transcriptional regulator
MEAAGQVSRRQDSQDKRRPLGQITEQGRRILAENMSPSQEIYQKIEAQMGREKLESLLDLLEDLQAVRV